MNTGWIIVTYFMVLFVVVVVLDSIAGSGTAHFVTIHGHHCIERGWGLSQTLTCKWGR